MSVYWRSNRNGRVNGFSIPPALFGWREASTGRTAAFSIASTCFHARNASGRKRLRVATRQIFVFSCALDFGFEDGRRAVTHGLEFLFEHARNPDGGFTSDFDLSLARTSERRDSYDLAFVVLALAHSYRRLGDVRLLDEALTLAHFFESRLRHPAGGIH